MDALRSLGFLDVSLLAIGSWALFKLVQAIFSRVKTTALNGPPSSSLLFGVALDVLNGDPGILYEKWAQEYGPVFRIPAPLGERQMVLTDPKAVAHFYSKDTFTYQNNNFTRRLIGRLIGKGLLYAEEEDHRRQRRSLNPAFVNAAIRNITPIFFDSGYKVKSAWDSLILSSGSDEAIIDVQKWMSCVSLDTIGIAGFGHDFGALRGHHSSVAETFEAFSAQPGFGAMVLTILLGPVLPILLKLPSHRNRLNTNMQTATIQAAKEFLKRSHNEKELGAMGDTSRSIIGSLLRAESSSSEKRLTEEEVIGQIRLFLIAGYETTSVSLTWALIELALHPDVQDKLRAELSVYANADPSYDELHNSLPYLNAVTREVIRLHPPVEETRRMATRDDVIPLSSPIITTSGEQVDSITVTRGTNVIVPIRCINRSEEIWGQDAKEFKPERWLDNEAGLPGKAKSLQGYHHILSFVDGPRTCLGRPFALAEFKSVLSVLVRNYVFDMRDGPNSKIEMVKAMVPRPTLAGEKGAVVPMRVRRYEH